MNLYITKSKRKNNKYDLLDTDKKYLLSFGDNRYSDYTMHKDDDRKKYLSRHGKEDHSAKNIKSAAFMSAHLLGGLEGLSNNFGANTELLTWMGVKVRN